MCGRYQLIDPHERYETEFDIKGPPPRWNWRPYYNFSPTQTGIYVTADRHLEVGSWGLIPSWSKSGKMERATFNARAETVQTSALFRPAFKSRRCIVPASAFYEWTGPQTARQPHEIKRVDEHQLAFAGLWDRWNSPDGTQMVSSYTIVVCPANEFMSKIHDRMPVILDKADYEQWLSGTPDEAANLMRPAPEGILRERVVNRAINKAGVEGSWLLDPDASPPVEATKLS